MIALPDETYIVRVKRSIVDSHLPFRNPAGQRRYQAEARAGAVRARGEARDDAPPGRRGRRVRPPGQPVLAKVASRGQVSKFAMHLNVNVG